VRHLKLILRGDAAPEELFVAIDGPRCELTRGGSAESAQVTRLPDGRLSLLFDDGRQVCGRVLPAGAGEVEVTAAGCRRRVALAEPLQDRIVHATGAAGGPGEDEEVRALMPGRVVEVAVAVGDRVAPGALLLVLEAMKMQNEIRTAQGGDVVRVEVGSGSRVERGELLVVVKTPGEPGVESHPADVT
jgi:biotin carboxyl carrier protein